MAVLVIRDHIMHCKLFFRNGLLRMEVGSSLAFRCEWERNKPTRGKAVDMTALCSHAYIQHALPPTKGISSTSEPAPSNTARRTKTSMVGLSYYNARNLEAPCFEMSFSYETAFHLEIAPPE